MLGQSGAGFLGRIDPDRLGELFEPGRAVDEALGAFEVGGRANAVPIGEDRSAWPWWTTAGVR